MSGKALFRPCATCGLKKVYEGDAHMDCIYCLHPHHTADTCEICQGFSQKTLKDWKRRLVDWLNDGAGAYPASEVASTASRSKSEPPSKKVRPVEKCPADKHTGKHAGSSSSHKKSSSSSSKTERQATSKSSSGDRPRSSVSRDASAGKSATKSATKSKGSVPATCSLTPVSLTMPITIQAAAVGIPSSTVTQSMAWQPEVCDPAPPEVLLQPDTALSVSSVEGECGMVMQPSDLGLRPSNTSTTSASGGVVPLSSTLLTPQKVLSLDVLNTLQKLLQRLDTQIPQPGTSSLIFSAPSVDEQAQAARSTIKSPSASQVVKDRPRAQEEGELSESDSIRGDSGSDISLSPSRDPTWNSDVEVESTRSQAQPSPPDDVGAFHAMMGESLFRIRLDS